MLSFFVPFHYTLFLLFSKLMDFCMQSKKNSVVGKEHIRDNLMRCAVKEIKDAA